MQIIQFHIYQVDTLSLGACRSMSKACSQTKETIVCRDLGTLGRWPGCRLKQWMPECQPPTNRTDQFSLSHQGTSQTTHFPAKDLHGSVHVTVPEGGYWIRQNALRFLSFQPLIFIFLWLAGRSTSNVFI